MTIEEMRQVDAVKTYKELEELKAKMPTGTEAKVCELIARRQRAGIEKYGQTVANNPLALKQWLQHALEETLDKAIYLQRAIEELEKEIKP